MRSRGPESRVAAELAVGSGRSLCAMAVLPYDARAGFGASRVRRQVRPEQLRTAVRQDRLSGAPCARVEKKKRTATQIFPNMAGSASRERGIRPQDDGGQAADALSTTRADFSCRRFCGGRVQLSAPFGAIWQCASVCRSQGLARGSSGPHLRRDHSAPTRVLCTHACAARYGRTARELATAKSTLRVSTVEKKCDSSPKF